MSILKGRDLVVLVDDAPVFHATQHQITLNADFEDWETKSLEGKQKTLTGHSGTVQVDGLVATEVGDGEHGVDQLLILLKDGAPVALLSELPMGTKTDKLATISIPKAWATSVSMTGQVGQNTTYSAQFAFNDFEV